MNISLAGQKIKVQESEDDESEQEVEFKNFSVSSADSNDSVLENDIHMIYEYPVKPRLNSMQSV